jgi:hemerythrin superfamily protein
MRATITQQCDNNATITEKTKTIMETILKTITEKIRKTTGITPKSFYSVECN